MRLQMHDEGFLRHLHERAKGALVELRRTRAEDCPQCDSPECDVARVCTSRLDPDIDEHGLDREPMCRHATAHALNEAHAVKALERRGRMTRAGCSDRHLLDLVAPVTAPPEAPRAWFGDGEEHQQSGFAWRVADQFAHRYRQNRRFPRQLLVLRGSTGTGKSARAAWIVAGVPVSACWLPATAVDRLPTWDEVAPRAAKAALLVIDDLGTERVGSGWGREQLRTLIGERYNAGLATVITTNLEEDRIVRDYGGDRLASRLAEDGLVVPCGLTDLRRSAPRRGSR